MPRFLHTADWQLGLKLKGVPGDPGARARDERFRVIERLADLARAEAVDAVVVCGDVFDDNQVAAWTMQRARDALARFAPIPVLLLPGNHDAAEPGGAIARLGAGNKGLEHVTALLDGTLVATGGLTFFPCPLTRRHTPDDPTRDLPAREPGDDAVRVVLAHGGAIDFGGSEDALNRIDVPAVLRKGFDYVALGDWHGTKRIDPRAWYPGAPEPTRFKELDPGNALLVSITAAGALPEVTVVPVAGTRWHEPEPVDLHGAEDVDRLDAWLGGLSPRGSCLVRLHLRGALRVDERARLDTLLARHATELLHLDLATLDVATLVDATDLDALDAPGFLGATLQDLLTGDDPVRRDAAALLVRLVAEARGA